MINKLLIKVQNNNYQILKMTRQKHFLNVVKAQGVFSSNESYHEHQEHYKKQISLQNNQEIVNVIIAIQGILLDDQSDPYSRLLALRFIKQAFAHFSYSFATLVNSLLTQIFFQVALYKKTIQEEDRAQDIFSNQFSAFNHMYLRRIGVSYQKIILQMYQSLSKIIPFCPYSLMKFKQNSSFKTHYEALVKQKVKFPESRTYLKAKQVQKIEKSYKQHEQNQSNCSLQIQNFYQYLINLLQNEQIHQHAKRIALKIVESGDQCRNCVHYLINYLKRKISVQENELKSISNFKLIGSLLRTADMESIKKIQSQLFLQLLNLYQNNRLKDSQLRQVCTWGLLIQSLEVNSHHNYIEISKLINLCKKQDIAEDIQKFKKQFIKMRDKNSIKLANLHDEVQKLEMIRNYIEQLKKKKVSIAMNGQTIKIAPQVIDIQPILLTPRSNKKKFERFINSDKGSINEKQMDRTFKSNAIEHYYFKSVSKSNGETLREPKILGGVKRNDRIYKSVNNTSRLNSELTSVRSQFSKDSIQNSKQKQSNSSHNFQELHEEIVRAKTKQRQLQLQLKQKNEIIRKLQQQSSKQIESQDFKSILSYPSHYNTNTQSHLKSVNSSNYFLNSLDHLSAQSKNYMSFGSQLYKEKKHLLKKKVLLYKSALIQLGMITKVVDNIIKCSIFFTPFVNLHSVTVQIKCPGNWIEPHSKQCQTKSKVISQSQYIIMFELECARKLSRKSNIFQKPQLQISFYKQKTEQLKVHKTQLPIFINKLCNDEHSLNLIQLKSILCEQYGNLTKQFKIDSRICKNFADFCKYFPNSVFFEKDESSGTFITFLQAMKIQFYLQMKILQHDKSMLTIIFKRQEGVNIQVLQVFLEGFCYLFGL